MTIIDIVAALSEGSLPSNKQLLAWLQVIEEQCHNSEEGQGRRALLRRDTQDLVYSLRGLVSHRNASEEIQEIIWLARGGVLRLEELVSREEVERRKRARNDKKRKDTQSADFNLNAHVQTTARTLTSHLLTLTRTILIQPQLRRLVMDCVNLLVQVGDETVVGSVAKETTTTPPTLTVQDLEALESRLKGVVAELQRRGGAIKSGQYGDVVAPLAALQGGVGNDAIAGPATNGTTVAPPNSTTAGPTDSTLVAPSNGSTAPSANGSIGSAPALDTLQLLTVDGLLARVTSLNPHDIASHTARNAKLTWQREGRRRVLARTRQLLVDVQQDASTQATLLWLFEGVERVVRGVVALSETAAAKQSQTSLAITPHVVSLLEQFVGVGNVSQILTLTRRLSIGYHEDHEVRAVFQDVDTFARRCIREAGWVMDDACEVEFAALVKRFKSLRTAYQSDIQRLLHLVSTSLTAVKTDAVLLSVLSALKQLGKDLTLGGNTPLPSGAALQELFHSILPPLFKHSVLPIPRVKYTHPDFVLVLENIAVSLRDLCPDTVDLRVTNDLHVDLQRVKRRVKRGQTFAHSHSFKLKIKGLGLRVHKVAFAVDLLKGIKLHDKGILDLHIQDVGFTIYIDVPRESSSEHTFVVRKVRSRLGKLSVKVRQSNHAILHKLAEGLVDSGMTKFILRRLMSKGITLGLQQLDVALMQLKLNGWVFKSTEDTTTTKEKLVRVKRQAAELRDAMRRMREQAGTLEVDFVVDGVGVVDKWSQENGKVWAWIKGLFERTGAQDVRRGEKWQSDVFDIGVDKNLDGQITTSHQDNATPHASAMETPKEAARRHKPQGPTTQETVEDADVTVKKQKRKYWPWFGGRGNGSRTKV